MGKLKGLIVNLSFALGVAAGMFGPKLIKRG
jgi:hypothetical protein